MIAKGVSSMARIIKYSSSHAGRVNAWRSGGKYHVSCGKKERTAICNGLSEEVSSLQEKSHIMHMAKLLNQDAWSLRIAQCHASGALECFL